jgi:hypothetical protein
MTEGASLINFPPTKHRAEDLTTSPHSTILTNREIEIGFQFHE